MKQTFELCLSTDNIANDAKQLGVSADDLKRISINVSAQVIKQPTLRLQLTYQISVSSQILAHKLHWPVWQSTRVEFSDYLWEETCLECFIAGDSLIERETTESQQTASYIEINASPDGRYALYNFKSYRNPATLPPVPLYKDDGRTPVSIDWVNHTKPSISAAEVSHNASVVMDKHCDYERVFTVPLDQLSNQQYAIQNLPIEQIHPCVILRFGETALYFASSHASPADFHNRHHWPTFSL